MIILLLSQQVKWSIYMDFVRAVGIASSLAIVISFALYHVAFVTSDVFLSQWTDDTRLNNLTLLPPNSTERMDLNEYYLSLYGGFGALQGIVILLLHSRLAGLVVKASASGAEDPGFESRLRRDFSGSSHTSDFKTGTPVATLPGAWRYRISAGTGRPGVSIL